MRPRIVAHLYFDPQPLQTIVEGGPLNPEDACDLGFVAGTLIERGAQLSSFELVELAR
jgi:hypothetical protein